MTANARDPQGAADPSPPSGLTPPSGGATAPDSREALIRAAADAPVEAVGAAALLSEARGQRTILPGGGWADVVRAAVTLQTRLAVAPASARSAAPEGPA